MAQTSTMATADTTTSIAHVYMVDQGIDLANEDVQFLTYDDATGQLLAVKGGHVFAYDTAAAGPHSLRWMYPLQVRRCECFVCCILSSKQAACLQLCITSRAALQDNTIAAVRDSDPALFLFVITL